MCCFSEKLCSWLCIENVEYYDGILMVWTKMECWQIYVFTSVLNRQDICYKILWFCVCLLLTEVKFSKMSNIEYDLDTSSEVMKVSIRGYIFVQQS